jgi:dihydroorotate dehydrogenase (NAD+) catalytic subunit
MSAPPAAPPASSPPRMAVRVGALDLANPVVAASGCFGYGAEFADVCDLRRLGAVSTKGLSLRPVAGNPGPRVVETPGGMLNAIGLENVGVDAFLADKLPRLRALGPSGPRVIANIWDTAIEGYAHVARALRGAAGLHAIEVNISCPNLKEGGDEFGTNPRKAAEVTEVVKREADVPVIVKLSPNAGARLVEVARAVEAAGADAVSAINTITGMAVDLERRRPVLAYRTGGLSGPAVKPLALRMVWQLVQALTIPVMGIGGIMTGRDAAEFLLVGARAVQVGTATFVDPGAPARVAAELEAFLAARGIADVNDWIGALDAGS